MATIAFLGLGSMGTPMATRLVAQGHNVIVWNRTRERTASLAAAGARVAESPAAAVDGVEFAITMLATPDALEEVLFGPDGLGAHLGPGQTLIDMSTVGADAFRAVASRLPRGVAAVDAPVRGSVPEATEGNLHVYVGATDADFQRVRPVLDTFGALHHVGPAGAGAAMKLVVNTTLVTAIVAFGEALALAATFGLDQGTTLDILAESSVGPTVKAKRANVETRTYPPSFKLYLAAKDVRLALAAAARAGVVLPAAATVGEWLDKAADEGAADLDFSAVMGTILGSGADPAISLGGPT